MFAKVNELLLLYGCIGIHKIIQNRVGVHRCGKQPINCSSRVRNLLIHTLFIYSSYLAEAMLLNIVPANGTGRVILIPIYWNSHLQL